MAQEQSVSYLIPPAQLFVGPQELLNQQVKSVLQKIFCAHTACQTCLTCQQINNQQHPNMLWLLPEKNYALDDLEVIFETTALALNSNEHFFFIIEKADFLTTACANKLLKILEEPPTGYHFMLCAERSAVLLPTIKSRCITTSFFGEHQQQIHHNLASFFTGTTSKNPLEFLKELDASKINEHESLELLDHLLSHWTKKYKEAVLSHDLPTQNSSEKKVALFAGALLNLPMPGSSKIFWKNLFLQIS